MQMPLKRKRNDEGWARRRDGRDDDEASPSSSRPQRGGASAGASGSGGASGGGSGGLDEASLKKLIADHAKLQRGGGGGVRDNAFGNARDFITIPKAALRCGKGTEDEPCEHVRWVLNLKVAKRARISNVGPVGWASRDYEVKSSTLGICPTHVKDKNGKPKQHGAWWLKEPPPHRNVGGAAPGEGAAAGDDAASVDAGEGRTPVTTEMYNQLKRRHEASEEKLNNVMEQMKEET
jgi:hypothetical protein